MRNDCHLPSRQCCWALLLASLLWRNFPLQNAITWLFTGLATKVPTYRPTYRNLGAEGYERFPVSCYVKRSTFVPYDSLLHSSTSSKMRFGMQCWLVIRQHFTYLKYVYRCACCHIVIILPCLKKIIVVWLLLWSPPFKEILMNLPSRTGNLQQNRSHFMPEPLL